MMYRRSLSSTIQNLEIGEEDVKLLDGLGNTFVVGRPADKSELERKAREIAEALCKP